MDKRLGGPQSRSGRGGEEKNSRFLPGLEPPITQPVAQRYITDVSRLLQSLFLLILNEYVFTNDLIAIQEP
jgi:hypothetical protein